MNYKDIIKNRTTRLKILQMLSFVPDKTMIKLQYRIKQKRTLNMKNPQRYTEKLQLYKLYYRDPIMAKCSDKFTVRRYVEKKGLGNILNELIGIYDRPEEVNFKNLPNEFVIKSTVGGGGNNIIICKDKSKLDLEKTLRDMKDWMKICKNGGREWVYDKSKPRIIIEKLIQSDSDNDLKDYKFFCFNGKAFCLYVVTERFNSEIPKLGIFDLKFNQLNYYRCDEGKLVSKVSKPKDFEKMIEISEILSKGFPHVRVDLYNSNGKVIFGEMTFFDGSGYHSYSPDEFDFLLGKEFHTDFNKCGLDIFRNKRKI